MLQACAIEGKGMAILSRSLPGIGPALRTNCPPGAVTLLADEGGADIGAYEAFFLGTGDSSVFGHFGSEPWNAGQVAFDGFGAPLPAHLTAAGFLASAGYTSEEIDPMLDRFDLRRTSYLHCTQLSESSARQLSLLALLRSNANVWILRDPFLPFSGRWREYFAQLILDNIKQRDLTIICTRVSFIPQCWSRSTDVNVVDVGSLAEHARERARREQEAEARQSVHSESVQLTVTQTEAPQSGVAIVVPIPEELGKFYNAVDDWLWAPLAELSNRLRRFAWPLTALTLAAGLAFTSTTFFPNLKSLQAKLSQLDFSAHEAASPSGSIQRRIDGGETASAAPGPAEFEEQMQLSEDDQPEVDTSVVVFAYSHEPLSEDMAELLVDESLSGEQCTLESWPLSWKLL